MTYDSPKLQSKWIWTKFVLLFYLPLPTKKEKKKQLKKLQKLNGRNLGCRDFFSFFGGGDYFLGNLFQGGFFPRGPFPRGPFSRGTFTGGIFSGFIFSWYRYIQVIAHKLFLPHFSFSYTKSNIYKYVHFSIFCVRVDYRDKHAANIKWFSVINRLFAPPVL